MSACASLEGHHLVTAGERFDPAPATAPYVLDVGDMLHVQVYGEATIAGDYAVETDGKIDLPLIGRIDAAGKTAGEVAQNATALYGAGYLKSPSVTAEVRVYRPFFILGEVGMAGQYPYVPGMTRARPSLLPRDSPRAPTPSSCSSAAQAAITKMPSS
jgi:polysaccharide export outer membrane protein